jgi:hypothetical protein
MPLGTNDVLEDVFAAEPLKLCGHIIEDPAEGEATRSMHNLSAIAGALASCAAWLIGTLAIFALQGNSAAEAAVGFIVV